MPTPNASAETCPTGSTITYGMFLVCSSDSSADEIFDKRSMTPNGLRSMALWRQLLVSFLVAYSLKSGPAQLTVMPMPKSLAYEVVSLTISTDPLLVISLTTSSIDRMVLVVGSFLRNPASSRSSSTLSRVSSETPSRPLMTLDTVAGGYSRRLGDIGDLRSICCFDCGHDPSLFVRDAAKNVTYRVEKFSLL